MFNRLSSISFQIELSCPNRNAHNVLPHLKQKFVRKIRSCLDHCTNIFVIRLYNERTDKLQAIRAHFPPSESSYFFFGKNHVMQLALGRTPATEYLPSLSKIFSSLLEKWKIVHELEIV